MHGERVEREIAIERPNLFVSAVDEDAVVRGISS